MKLTVLADVAAVVAAARARLESAASETLDAGPDRGFSLALAGGSTPRALYRAIASDPPRIDWRRALLFFGDERCVPPDHPDSNVGMVRECLQAGLAVITDRLRPMNGALGSTPDGGAQAALDYAITIESTLGPDPRLDLALLGVGRDGHTASLFPRSPALAVRDVPCVHVREAGLEPFVPRLTLTLPMFERARRILFLVTGGEKAAVLADMLHGIDQSAALPAQPLCRLPQAEILVDRAAAAALPAPIP